jgi:L-serine/L-threonine ammonia-lyase
MESLHYQTPLIYSRPFSRSLGKEVYLKMECFQPSGSFKNRGMGAQCAYYAKEGYKGVVIASGGNAALAAAYSARNLGLAAVTVVSTKSPSFMHDKLRREGAEVIVHGSSWKESNQKAMEIAEKNNYAPLSPFDHEAIWKGNSTLVPEIVDSGIKPDAVLLSVGGGGLMCGVVQGLKDAGWKNVAVITSEPEGAAGLYQSLKEGRLVTLDRVESIATSLCAPRVAERAFELSRQHPVRPTTVTDSEAAGACVRFSEDHRVVVEPACGAALAPLYGKSSLLDDYSTIVVVVCGGNLVSLDLLEEWKSL